MNIVWEKNSRVLALAADGKIDYKDIIDRTTTDNFPAGTATVRMQGLNEKQPHTVLHIRGKSKQKPYRMISGTFQCATTCRVTLDNAWKGYGMSSNGILDEDLSWLDVHNIVTEVKGAMGL